jgi:hypothetical protein
MAKRTAGTTLKENLFIDQLGFKAAYVAAVVRNNDPQRPKAFREEDMRSSLGHWHLTETERSSLTPYNVSSGRCTLYVSSWCGLDVLKAHVEGGKCNGAHAYAGYQQSIEG